MSYIKYHKSRFALVLVICLLLALVVIDEALSFKLQVAGADVAVKGAWYDVRYRGARGNGVADDRAAINNTATDAAGGLMFFPAVGGAATYIVGSNITLDETLWFGEGAVLQPGNGVTITINGAIIDTTAQIFDLSAGGAIGGSPRVGFIRPEWFGAVADGATNNSGAFDDAVDFADSSDVGEIRFASGDYYFATALSYSSISGIRWIGSGSERHTAGVAEGTNLVANGIAVGTPAITLQDCDGWEMQDIKLLTNGTKAQYGIVLGNLSSDFYAQNLDVRNFTTASLCLAGAWNACFVHCTFTQSTYGIFQTGNSQAIQFIGCKIIQNTGAAGYYGFGNAFEFLGCDFEGQTRGIWITSDCEGLVVDSCYFESMTNSVIMHLVNLRESRIGPCYITGANDDLYMDGCTGVSVDAWEGDITLTGGNRGCIIKRYSGTLTNNDPAWYNLVLDNFLDEGTNNIFRFGSFGTYDTTGAPSTGAEIVTNPTFDVNTNGWTAVNAVLTSQPGGFSNNCLRVAANSGAAAYARQSVSVIPGVLYEVNWYGRNGTKGSYSVDIDADAYDAPPDGDLYNTTQVNAAWTNHVVYIQAKTNTIYIQLWHGGGNLLYCEFDEFSIKPVLAGTLSSGGDFYALSEVIAGKNARHDGYIIRPGAELETTDAVQTTIEALTLEDENTYQAEAYVVAVQSDGTDRASYHFACTVYRTGAGNATLQGGVTSLHSQESNAALDATFTVNGNDLRVSVTGIAAETWEWGSTLRYINTSN